MKQALLYKTLPGNKVQCLIYPDSEIIEQGQRTKCGVRKNINGKLYSLVYGKVIVMNIDPIEKKPFFHFLPGTETLSFGTMGDTFACRSCPNWQIRQEPKINGKIKGTETTPEEIVKIAIANHCPSISYTYNEPTVFLEYALDTMKIAKKKGLKNVWVSNGFMSGKALDLISPYLDAVNIELKSFSEEFYRKYCDGKLKPVLKTLLSLKKRKIRTEITTLAIPNFVTEGTFVQIGKFIAEELGKKTPWHITRFFPEISWNIRHLYSDPTELVQKGCDIGMNLGLFYVYGGNVHGLESEDTYCPKCHKKMIDRTGYFVERYDKNGKCSACETSLDIIDK